MLTALLFSSQPGLAETQEGWFDHATSVAQREGYQVITTKELKNLYSDNKEFLLLDNRYAYEFSSGHLPEAKNISFDLSHMQSLSDEKKTELLEILGPDKDRIIVTYCRDFR